MEYGKILIGFIAGLVIGAGGGYYVGGITNIAGSLEQEETPRATSTSDNPFAEVETNPLENVKLNPFE
jgi:hypothetical protein